MNRIGDILHLRSWEAYIVNPEVRAHAKFKAPKGKTLVVAILGVENVDGSGDMVDVGEVFAALGWVPAPDPQPEGTDKP